MTRECHKQDPPTDKDSWLGKRRGFFPKGLGKLSSNEHICEYLHKTRCKDAAAEDEKDEVGVGVENEGLAGKCQGNSNTDIKNGSL